MKRIRQTEIAQRAGVSIATVSRVINQSGYVADDVRKRVEDAIADMGYLPTGRFYAQRKRIVGVIVPNSTVAPYFERLSQCVQRECEKMGFAAIFTHDDKLDNESLRNHVSMLSRLGVCGIVVCSFRDDRLEQETREALGKCGIPITFIERTAGCQGFHRVLVDNQLGTYQATQYLIRKGHRHLLYITKNRSSEVEHRRQEGFLSAIQEYKDANIQYQIRACESTDMSDAFEAAKAGFKKDAEITGIVTWNDIYAQGVLMYCYQNGKSVPDQVEIIGNDDVLAPYLIPPLSSVRMPLEEIAAAAIEIIDKSQEQSGMISARTVSLEPKLVIR